MSNHSSLHLFMLLISICYFISCGVKQTGHYSEEFVDGIRVITNSLIETDAKIQLTEDLSIGDSGGDEDYMFTSPRDIDVDSMGNIYVLDYQESTIKKYDPDGKYLLNIGRLGEGPGEFENPRAMCINSQDEIFVSELMSMNITKLDTEGDYLGAVEIGQRIDDFEVLNDGSLILGFKTTLHVGNNKPEYGYFLGRFDLSTKDIDVLYAEQQSRTARISDGSFTLEYPNFVSWAVGREEKIYAAAANKFEVSIFRLNGDLLSKFGLGIDPTPVSGDVLLKADEIFDKLESRLDMNFQRERELIKFFPILDSIHIDEVDRVWIQRYTPYWRDTPVEETVFDVFSEEGIFQFTSSIPHLITSDLLFKHGYLYVLTSEEAGYTKATRYQIVDTN